MSTDRELLELAARAAGLNYTAANFAEPGELEFGWGMVESMDRCWNPLTDDGDALRLMVDLGLPVDFDHSCGAVWAHNPWTGDFFNEPGTDELKGNPASLRRAIVRAAAGIGRAVQ